MPVFDLIKNVFAGGAAKLGEQVKEIIDESKFSAEEKAELEAKLSNAANKHMESMASLAQSEIEIHLKDVQDARDTNARIQETVNAGWLAKNVAYCLDILLCLVWSTCTVYILAKALKLVQDNTDMTIVLSIHGTITAVFMTIVNFHRGTSAGSKASGDTLRSIVKNK